jgi:hypothetical protein
MTSRLAWAIAATIGAGGELHAYEYACHEGNVGLVNMLAAARVEEGSQ